ncbi:tail fiber domain-containing protein [Xanthovirga aplysinae]|uniref:tail fiber domain-containing protein n=1 Tax=Xanthovirga aplysinae TaxID=2529853 RepID=UPI003CCDA395
MKDALKVVNAIGGYSYTWKDDAEVPFEGEDLGVIAQEIQQVLPLANVVQEKENGNLGVSYKRLIPLLIEAIKELTKEVNELKTAK